MIEIASDAGSRERPTAGVLLFAGIVLAALTEALASTVLSLGRGDIIGDIHATPDEFAWLDIGYTAMKFAGFAISPWLMGRVRPRPLMIVLTLTTGASCAFAMMAARLDLMVVLRAVQGMSGGVLLVAGQTLVFLAYPRRRQPILQAFFAMAAVVAPATVAPALQGWLLDARSWIWTFFSIIPIALAAAGALSLAEDPDLGHIRSRPLDRIGLVLAAASLGSLTYVLSQGSRWDWFEEPGIGWLTLAGLAAMAAFVAHTRLSGRRRLLNFAVFRSADFSFAFAVSFIAGAALFGSAFLIPSFAVSVLAFTLTAAGMLLLPSGALFAGALLLAALAIQFRGMPPIATVPLGILLVMAAMWMLSGSTSESGVDDLMPAILLRGLGLGFLFLPITLIAFIDLDGRRLASGIALFNTGRQLGGLAGVAWLQTLIDHKVAANVVALGANVTSGDLAAGERLSAVATSLAARGMEASEASRAATALLSRIIAGQAAVLAFDTAFDAVALLFVLAAPLLIAARIGLGRLARPRA